MNNVLASAILSLDSYNRGYNQSIIIPDNAAIGNFIAIKQSDLTLTGSARSAGFYAIAYQNNTTKEITISYRGTDNPLGLKGNDFINGWIGGAGFLTSQDGLAFSFYNDVAKQQNNNIAINPLDAKISLTGHSLGGGLAGLVASVYNKSATIFNNMAFEAAAVRTQTLSDPVLAKASGYLYDDALKQAVYGSYNNGKAWAPTYTDASTSKIHTYYEEGEILGVNRLAQKTPQHIETRGYTEVTETLDRHNMAGVVISLYADDVAMGRTGTSMIGTSWQVAGKYMWAALSDNDFAGKFIAKGLVAGGMNDKSDWVGILRSVLAYSAIDDGPTPESMPFGNTAIRALYNDANDLGKAIAKKPVLNDAPNISETYLTDISKVFVQFGGQLALNKVLNSTATASVLNGVLKFADVDNNHTLTIDFTDTVWKLANGGVLPSSIIARDDLIKDLLLNASDTVHADIRTQWGSIVSGSSNSEINGSIDRVVFATLQTGASIISDNPTGRATLFVHANGNHHQIKSKVA